MGCQGETGLQEDSLTPKTTEFPWGSESGTYGPRDATHPDKDTGAVPVTSCIPAGDSPTPEPAFQPPRCPTVSTHPGNQASSRGEAKDSALLSSRDAGLLVTSHALDITSIHIASQVSCVSVTA